MCAPGDDTGTIYGSLSAVLLAAALSKSRSPDVIRKITRLPRLFVAAVCLEMRPLWHMSEELKLSLSRSKEDFADILDALRCAADEVWWEIYAGSRTVQYLNLLRDGTLVGGGRQHWVDEGFDRE